MATLTPSSLPRIDAVDVVDLYGISAAGVDRYMTEAVDAPSVRLTGVAAERVAALWRRLPPGKQARCHTPPFGLRFYSAGRLVSQASICWECNNIFGEAGEDQVFFEFDASQPVSRDLLAECQRAIGHPAGDIWPAPIKLADLLERASSREVSRGWLYLPREWRSWDADTPAYMLDDDELDRREAEAEGRGYASTIDDQTLEDVVRAARDHLDVRSFAGRLEALIYYVRFDAFLPKVGAPDPPPWEETRLQLDREFYEALGGERADVPCRSPGCARGAVKLSALCRVHHFEQVQQRACPFSD
jgi:hypothetical protein